MSTSTHLDQFKLPVHEISAEEEEKKSDQVEQEESEHDTQSVLSEEFLKKILMCNKDNDYKFEESSLSCEIDPVALKNTIKYIYDLEHLTFKNMKTIIK